MLSNNIMDYMVVAQGKTTIPGVDDGEECELTDVRPMDVPSDFLSFFFDLIIENSSFKDFFTPLKSTLLVEIQISSI